MLAAGSPSVPDVPSDSAGMEQEEPRARPEVTPDKKKKSRMSSVNLGSSKNSLHFPTREEILQRAKAAKELLKEREMRECTFSPRINKNSAKMMERSMRYTKTPTRDEDEEDEGEARACPAKRSGCFDDERVGMKTLNRASGESFGASPRTPFSNRDPNSLAKRAVLNANNSRVRHSIAFLAEDRRVCFLDSAADDAGGGFARPERASPFTPRVSFVDSPHPPSSTGAAATPRSPRVWTYDENGKHCLLSESRDRLWEDVPQPLRPAADQQEGAPRPQSAPANRWESPAEHPLQPPHATRPAAQDVYGTPNTMVGARADGGGTPRGPPAVTPRGGGRATMHQANEEGGGAAVPSGFERSVKTPRDLEAPAAASGGGGATVEAPGGGGEGACGAPCPVPPPRHHRLPGAGAKLAQEDAKLAFEELNEDTPMGVLRRFVEQEGLDVRASSKKALYAKICEALENLAPQQDEESPPTTPPKVEDRAPVAREASGGTVPRARSDVSVVTSASEEWATASELSEDEGGEGGEGGELDRLIAGGVCGALRARLEDLERVRGAWIRRGAAVAVREAALCGDAAVLASLLGACAGGGGLLSLEAFDALLRPEAAPRLLQSACEEHQLDGIRALHKLLQHFSEVLISTPPAGDGPRRSSSLGTNVALEERQARCDALCEGLRRVEAAMQAVRDRRGRSGPLSSACCANIRSVLEARGLE